VKMSLTKADIVRDIHENCGLSKARAFELTEKVFEIIKGTLESGEEVLISGFGKFGVREKRRRRGRNPSTGSHMVLDGRRVVTFKCSGSLRAKMNGKG
jgi:integration host factor subunit alpha